MKTMIKAALAATVATGLFAAPALAAAPATGKFNATAKIVKPVTMARVDDLDFGTTTMLAALDTATVTVAASTGALAKCSDTTKLSCSGGKPALFNLSGGVGGQTIQISYTNEPTVLTHTDGLTTVGLDLATVSNIQLAADGTGSFHVGGEITVKDTTIDGVYSSVVNIEANYL